jgi:hypothetical protein
MNDVAQSTGFDQGDSPGREVAKRNGFGGRHEAIPFATNDRKNQSG